MSKAVPGTPRRTRPDRYRPGPRNPSRPARRPIPTTAIKPKAMVMSVRAAPSAPNQTHEARPVSPTEGWTGALDPRPESFQPASQRSSATLAASKGKLKPMFGTPANTRDLTAKETINAAAAAPQMPGDLRTLRVPLAMAWSSSNVERIRPLTSEPISRSRTEPRAWNRKSSSSLVARTAWNRLRRPKVEGRCQRFHPQERKWRNPVLQRRSSRLAMESTIETMKSYGITHRRVTGL